MLVLSRRKNESIHIGPHITVTIIEMRGDKVRVGIEAPPELSVWRSELAQALSDQELAAMHRRKVQERLTALHQIEQSTEPTAA